MNVIKTHRVHGGTLGYYEHAAASTGCDMAFTVFLPPKAKAEKCPVVMFLAGLTCTPENFTTKAHAYQLAAELGLVLVAPDTSPRGEHIVDDEAYDLGQGAGFYLNATRAPWSANYQMERYITQELLALLVAEFPADRSRIGIMGHSMGGHGALSLGLKHPEIFKSLSAFAPICAPSQCPWGQKAFAAYLGEDQTLWQQHDATALMKASALAERLPILIDQGSEDPFLQEQLHPQAFEEACKQAGHPLTLRRQEGYDHSYFFIETFIDDHLRHHASQL